jgi:hypothetical protein
MKIVAYGRRGQTTIPTRNDRLVLKGNVELAAMSRNVETRVLVDSTEYGLRDV